MPKSQERSEEIYIKKIYSRVIFLALLAHVSYVVIFALLSFTWLFLYNIVSSVFYVLMLMVVEKGRYKLAVTMVHIEVCLFVIACTVLGGWNLGIPLYLFALCALVYFCPYRHKYIPYLFACGEIFVFFVLKIVSGVFPSYYPALDGTVQSYLYLYNAGASFALILYAAFLSDVSAAVTVKELQSENKNLSDLANYDQLTGLLSRRFLMQKIASFPDAPILLALGDIDDFKIFNDTYGHSCGDYILRKCAQLMRICCTKADICRWGGEEFIFSFQHTAPEEVYAEMRRLCSAIARYEFLYGGQTLHVTMTFGISDSGGSQNMTPLIDQADQRMYAGKAQGKNRVVGPS